MSDALTDIARDQERGRLFDEYLESLRLYLIDPTQESKNKVLALASRTDSVSRGYFGGRTNLKEETEKRIDSLQQGNEEAWAKFLFSLEDRHVFQIFKALSPFANKLVIAVDYGCGFVNFHGDVESLIEDIVRKNKGWKTYDTDDYLVVLNKPNINKAEVHWVGCGILGQKGPRKSRS